MFNWIKRAKGGDSRKSPIPEWADSRRWSTLARELIKYQDAFKVEDPRHCLLNLDLSRYSKSEQKAAYLLGWIFLQALIDETKRREAVDVELQAVTDQLQILKECFRSSEKHKEEMETQFSEYVVRTVNKQRKKNGRRRLPGNNAAVKVRTLVTRGDWEELTYWSGSDTDKEIEIGQLEAGKARPIVTTRQRREVTGRASSSGSNVLSSEDTSRPAQAAEQQYTEETRSYTAGELTELGQKFAQRPNECLLSWVLRVWDLGGDGILLSNREAVGLGSMAKDPRVRLYLRRARDTTVVFSLLHLIRDSIVQVHDTPTELMDLTPWRTIGEGIHRLREYGCVSGLIADPLMETPTVHDNWTGPDMALFTAHMRNKFLANAPSHLKAPLFTMLSAIDAKKEKVHEAAALLGQLGELERVGDRVKQRSVEEKDPVERLKITQRELFLDLLQSGVPISEIDGIQTSSLLKRWKELKSKGKLKSSLPKKVATSDVEDLPVFLSAPPVERKSNPYGAAAEELMKHKKKFGSRGWEVPTPLE
ncbi:uncharacterized protein LOC143974381 [Lithobates pipiens]